MHSQKQSSRLHLKFVSIFSWSLIIFAVCVFTGCSGKRVTSDSGFLGDTSVYRSLEEHPKFKGVMVKNYEDPGYLRGAKFIIPPVKIYLNKKGQKRDIKQKDLADLSVFFRNELIKALEDRYTVTHIPGPKVYTIELAISDADPNIPLLNIHPGTVISGAGLGGATIEMAIEDSSTGQLMSAVTASDFGKRYKYTSGLSKWGHTKSVLKDFAQNVRQRLDEINADQGMNG